MKTFTQLYNQLIYPLLAPVQNFGERSFFLAPFSEVADSICVYSTFISTASGKATLPEQVRLQLSAYHEQGLSNVLVVTSDRMLSGVELKSLCNSVASFVSLVLVRKNFGYDFYSWKRGLCVGQRSLKKAPKEVLFTNDSILGPLWNLSKDFEWLRAESQQRALKSLTRSDEIELHLQSYFLYFNQALCAQGLLKSWMSRIRPYRDKADIINLLEVGGSRYLKSNGVTLLAKYNPSNNSAKNPTLFCWEELIEKNKFPFLKRSLLSFHRHFLDRQKLKRLLDLMGKTGDVNLEAVEMIREKVDETIGQKATGFLA